MRNTGYWFIALFLLVMVAACKQEAPAISAEDAAHLKEIEGLPRVGYNKGGASFTLAEFEGLKPVSRDSVPWANMMIETEDNGQVIYFFFPGYAIDLGSPQIRVEFMSRSLKGCSSADSIMIWLKGLFVNPDQNGTIIGENELDCVDGGKLTLLEILRPERIIEDSLLFTEKRMAWAYAEQKEHIIGFSFTALNEDDYNQNMALFRDLIRSYKPAQ